MNTNLTAYAELKASLDAIVAEVAKLKATQPNLDYFANQLGNHLVKFETDVTSSFTDKFAGNLFRATDAWNSRVTAIEDTLVRLEKTLNDQAGRYDEMLNKHHTRTTKMLKLHEKAVSDLLADNDKKLAEQKTTINGLVEVWAGYDKHYVGIHNSVLSLVESNKETVSKVDTAVEKFDQISTGHLLEVAQEAEQRVLAVSETARREMETVSAEARLQIAGTRKHYKKVLSGFDNRFAEHPLLGISLFILVVAIAFGFIGVWAGRIGEARHTQQLVDAAVDSAAAKVEERMLRIEEQTKSLKDTFEEAQYWDALTNNMSYDQKMSYIKLAQEQAQRQGRKLDLPKSMQGQSSKK